MPRSRRTSAGRARPNAARFVRTSSGELGRTPCPKTIILGPYCNVYLLTTPYALKHRLSVRRRFEPEDGVGVTVPAIHAGKFFRVGRFIAARVTGGTGEGGVRRTLIAADRELRGRAFFPGMAHRAGFGGRDNSGACRDGQETSRSHKRQNDGIAPQTDHLASLPRRLTASRLPPLIATALPMRNAKRASV